MKSILKAIKGKPSIALQHMVDGLSKQSKRKDFKIDMSTFGTSEGKICYGCAATCAIQNITKINLTSQHIGLTHIRASKTETDYYELDTFENAINNARKGVLVDLFIFCKLSTHDVHRFSNHFDLWNDNWKEELPKVRKLIKELKKAGY